MILVDTSVWIDHLRRGNAELADLLRDEQVLTHPFVIGELACGGLRNRQVVLSLLSALPGSEPASHDEVLTLIDRRRLAGTGIGWIDAHLLASALCARATLWTLDHRLQTVGHRVGVSRRTTD